jgi:type I restriction enzyme, S subunit
VVCGDDKEAGRVSAWREVMLGDVLTLQRGFDLPARDRVNGPFPIVSSSGVTGHHATAKVDPPGVVIGRYGSLGSVHWVTEPFWPLNTSLWVKDFHDNDPRYLSYLLRTVSVDGSTASAVPGVNRNHLHILPVRVPDVRSQRRIAAVLHAFDELIEINARRIELIEALVRSLYHEWFVRFRFPGREELAVARSTPGGAPEGWVSRRVGDIARLSRRSVNPMKQPSALFEHFSIPAFDAQQLPFFEPGGSIQSSKFSLDGDRVLLSKLNPRIPRVWFAAPETNSAIASSEFLPWDGTEVSNAWLWAMFSGGGFRNWLVATAGGTSTSHQRVKPDDVLSHRVSIAGSGLLRRFDSIAEPSLQEVIGLRQQNRCLATTRDFLLPRIVSGRTDISDIDLGDLFPTEAA